MYYRSTRYGKGEPVEQGLRALAVAAALAIATPVEALTLNIVAIGASNTAGWGVGLGSSYPTVLEGLLRKQGIDANVTNSGILLDRTRGLLPRFVPPARKEPVISTLHRGGNDLRFSGPGGERTANITAMVNRLLARRIRVIVYDPDPIPPEAY